MTITYLSNLARIQNIYLHIGVFIMYLYYCFCLYSQLPRKEADRLVENVKMPVVLRPSLYLHIAYGVASARGRR